MRNYTHVQPSAQSTTQRDMRHGMGNINHRYVDGETPLVVAIKAKNLEKLKLLLERGADVEEADKDGKIFLVVLLSCLKSS